MNFRVARHTTDLKRITEFYTEILGLEVLGSFQDHNRYDGVFLGVPKMDWCLEFTASSESPQHQPDEDDLLVFYPSGHELKLMLNKIKEAGIKTEQPRNPYWIDHGILVRDPDGFGVVISSQKVD